MLRLEHIGIAVQDVPAMARVLEDVLRRTPYKAETVGAEGVRTLFLEAGGAKLELLEAMGPDSPIAGFLDKRGPGIHHLAFEVEDLESESSRLQALGYQLLGKPRPGADGKQIIFLHPRGTGKVLIELCQQAGFAATADSGVLPSAEVAVATGALADPLAHALCRYFAVARGAGERRQERVSVTGSLQAPMVSIAPAARGDSRASADGFEIRVYPEGLPPATGSNVTLPAAVWSSLPDPWGHLADIVAVRIRSQAG